VAQAERRDLYLRPPLLSPDYARDEEGQETKRPRLTLRYLHELIDDIHVENDRLAEQIDTLSNQLDELSRKLDALDVLRDDNELAAGLASRSVQIETAASAEALVARNAGEGDTMGDRTEETAVREVRGDSSAMETGVAGASEAFAREWAQIPLADAMPSVAGHGHGENELPASLQERMIENVKEAARIAEEIAAQAAAHAAAGTEQAARPLHGPVPQPPGAGQPVEQTVQPQVPAQQETQPPDGTSIVLVPAEPQLAPGSGHDEATLTTPKIALGEPPAETPAPPPGAKLEREQPVAIRDAKFRYETSAVHTYIPPRAERHAGTKKRSFWSRLFRRASM